MLWGEVHVCGDSLGFSSMVMRNVGLYNNPTTHNQMFFVKAKLIIWKELKNCFDQQNK